MGVQEVVHAGWQDSAPIVRDERRVAATAGRAVGVRSSIVLVAAASVASGAIHVQAARAHWSVWIPAAVFFVVCAAAQLVWPYALVARPGLYRPLLAVGAVGNALVVMTWALSRTIELPFSPMGIEPVGWGDAVCSGYEVAIVAGCVALLARRVDLTGPRGRSALVAWTAVGALACATTLVVPTVS